MALGRKIHRPVFVFPAALVLSAALATPAQARGLFYDCFWQRLKVMTHLKLNRFEVKRDLRQYARHFGPDFIRRIKALGPEGHWVDAGAGEARAIAEFAGILKDQSYPQVARSEARVTGIAYSAPRSIRGMIRHESDRPDARFRYMSGRYIENIPAKEIGRAELITDYLGPLSYSDRIDRVLNKYLEILKPGGAAFMSFLDITTIIPTRGPPLPLREWLMTFQGNGIQIEERIGQAMIKKVSETGFRFPKLELVKIKGDLPPTRIFRVVPD